MSWSDRTPKQKEAYRKYSAGKIDEHYRDRKNREEFFFVMEEEERNIEDSLMFAGNIQDQVQIEQTADDDPNVRVIVLTGVGRAFCAGADLRGAREGEDPGDFQLGNHGTVSYTHLTLPTSDLV